MITTIARSTALALLVLAGAAPAFGATVAPKAAPRAVRKPAPVKKSLHASYVVEVNKRGQIVRAETAVYSGDAKFNTVTYGNVLQMWIRHPDGTAQVGRYRVNYDYDPKIAKTIRHVTLVTAGGTWGDKKGAVLQMLEMVKPVSAKDLPALDRIIGATPKPKPTP